MKSTKTGLRLLLVLAFAVFVSGSAQTPPGPNSGQQTQTAEQHYTDKSTQRTLCGTNKTVDPKDYEKWVAYLDASTQFGLFRNQSVKFSPEFLCFDIFGSPDVTNWEVDPIFPFFRVYFGLNSNQPGLLITRVDLTCSDVQSSVGSVPVASAKGAAPPNYCCLWSGPQGRGERMDKSRCAPFISDFTRVFGSTVQQTSSTTSGKASGVQNLTMDLEKFRMLIPSQTYLNRHGANTLANDNFKAEFVEKTVTNNPKDNVIKDQLDVVWTYEYNLEAVVQFQNTFMMDWAYPCPPTCLEPIQTTEKTATPTPSFYLFEPTDDPYQSASTLGSK